MRTPFTVAAAIALSLVLGVGCGGDDEPEATGGSTSPTESESSTSTTAEPSTTAPTSTSDAPTTATSTTTEPTTLPAATGPQECGSVTSTIGGEVVVEIVAGDVDCAFAEDLLDTYYNAPPSPPEGSGAYVTIGDWECNSSSSQEPGRASTCRTASGGEIVARG